MLKEGERKGRKEEECVSWYATRKECVQRRYGGYSLCTVYASYAKRGGVGAINNVMNSVTCKNTPCTMLHTQIDE